MKQLFLTIILALVAITVNAETTGNYEVVKECQELGLYKGDIVKITISKPTSYETPIYISKFPSSEFEMKHAHGGMASFGENGYSSNYTIHDERVRVYRTANNYRIQVSGRYVFELCRKK